MAFQCFVWVSVPKSLCAKGRVPSLWHYWEAVGHLRGEDLEGGVEWLRHVLEGDMGTLAPCCPRLHPTDRKFTPLSTTGSYHDVQWAKPPRSQDSCEPKDTFLLCKSILSAICSFWLLCFETGSHLQWRPAWSSQTSHSHIPDRCAPPRPPSLWFAFEFLQWLGIRNNFWHAYWSLVYLGHIFGGNFCSSSLLSYYMNNFF